MIFWTGAGDGLTNVAVCLMDPCRSEEATSWPSWIVAEGTSGSGALSRLAVSIYDGWDIYFVCGGTYSSPTVGEGLSNLIQWTNRT